MNTFVENGYTEIPNFFNKSECLDLMRSALNTRNINNLFLTKEQFEKEKKFKGVNPIPGRNLLDKFNTDFIFLSKKFKEEMNKVCGKNYKILNSKFVMGIPHKFIPSWLEIELKDSLVSNLGPYVKEIYRDITYFRGIDWHQDIIDYPERNSDFITAYIYLDKVNLDCAPLYLLKKSHMLGASIFPHKLLKIKNKQYLYTNDFNEKIICDSQILLNEGGTLYYWNCNMPHGTKPQLSDNPRISIRILIEKNIENKETCLIDLSNKQSKGNLSLARTRKDLDEQGQAILRGNTINKEK